MAERQKARNQRSGKRPIRIEGDVAYVTLTRGCEAIIDAIDVPLVDRWNWHATFCRRTVYARRNGNSAFEQCSVIMHRVIMGAPDGLQIDHIDGNGLNNCRANLRLATSSENNRNSQLRRDSTSGLKGVSWHKRHKKWVSGIKANGKRIHLGVFDTAEAAYAAYVAANQKIHGEFGRVA
jgi:hypothetical protein